MVLPWRNEQYLTSCGGIALRLLVLFIVSSFGFGTDASAQESFRGLWLTDDPECPIYGVVISDDNKVTGWVGISLRGRLLLGDPDPKLPELVGQGTVSGDQISTTMTELEGVAITPTHSAARCQGQFLATRCVLPRAFRSADMAQIRARAF